MGLSNAFVNDGHRLAMS